MMSTHNDVTSPTQCLRYRKSSSPGSSSFTFTVTCPPRPMTSMEDLAKEGTDIFCSYLAFSLGMGSSLFKITVKFNLGMLSSARLICSLENKRGRSPQRHLQNLPCSTVIEGISVLPHWHMPSGRQIARIKAEHWSALALPWDAVDSLWHLPNQSLLLFPLCSNTLCFFHTISCANLKAVDRLFFFSPCDATQRTIQRNSFLM